MEGVGYLEAGRLWIPACEFVKKSDFGPVQSQMQA
jgi:hypothetical protein